MNRIEARTHGPATARRTARSFEAQTELRRRCMSWATRRVQYAR